MPGQRGCLSGSATCKGKSMTNMSMIVPSPLLVHAPPAIEYSALDASLLQNQSPVFATLFVLTTRTRVAHRCCRTMTWLQGCYWTS